MPLSMALRLTLHIAACLERAREADTRAARSSDPAQKAEYEMMARIAGLRLRERWDGWNREPYSGAGSTVVSVWGR